MLERVKKWAKRLKRHVFLLYFACKDRRSPWYAKLFAVCVVAYAFSPIDLIPDFIPVLGYLDDIVLVPLGVWAALKMIPGPVIEECRGKAEAHFQNGKPKNWLVGSLILLIWALAALWIGVTVYRYGVSVGFFGDRTD